MNKKILALLLTVAGFAGLASPAAAGSVSPQEDRVESASATLSHTLADQQAQQAELMRLQSVELARVQNLAFSTTLQSVLGQGSLDWLANQDDPLVTGIQPIPGRNGLLVSYAVPPEDPLAPFLTGRSYTYDNAVGAISFLLQGRSGDARSVLSALQRLMAPNGTLGFSYQVNSSWTDSRVRTGTLAWVGYAMALYQRQTGDRTFQANAEKIAVYLKGLQQSGGSLRGGPDVGWVSTEHNIDAYFFYRELYRVTRKSTYQLTAAQIKNSLLTRHWVVTGGTSGHFLQGIGDSTPALDANSWGAIFLSAIGRNAQANQALQYVESTFRTTQMIPGSSVFVAGYAPDSARGTIWLEGTLGVAAAYKRVGQTAMADRILSDVSMVQATWQSQGKWHGALPYALPRYRNSDGDTFSNFESTASTGWLLITLSVRNNSTSSFWNRD